MYIDSVKANSELASYLVNRCLPIQQTLVSKQPVAMNRTLELLQMQNLPLEVPQSLFGMLEGHWRMLCDLRGHVNTYYYALLLTVLS